MVEELQILRSSFQGLNSDDGDDDGNGIDLDEEEIDEEDGGAETGEDEEDNLADSE